MKKRKRTNLCFVPNKKIKFEQEYKFDSKYENEYVSECIICLDSKKDNAIIPCGHVCFCDTCLKLQIRNCPMCDIKIQSILKIYY